MSQLWLNIESVSILSLWKLAGCCTSNCCIHVHCSCTVLTLFAPVCCSSCWFSVCSGYHQSDSTTLPAGQEVLQTTSLVPLRSPAAGFPVCLRLCWSWWVKCAAYAMPAEFHVLFFYHAWQSSPHFLWSQTLVIHLSNGKWCSGVTFWNAIFCSCCVTEFQIWLSIRMKTRCCTVVCVQ